MRIKATVNDKQLNIALRRLIRKATPIHLGNALRVGAVPIQQEARQNAPFDTGVLMRSIKISNWFLEGRSVVVRIGTDLVYSAIHEFGGQIQVTAKMRAYLHFIGIHLRATTTAVSMRAQPYLRPAFRAKYRAALELIKEYLRSYVVNV